jgi:hypothetical protein
MEHSETARQFLETAQADGIVTLGVLGGMDLCILGGPRHPHFPEEVTKAWLDLSDHARGKLIEERAADLVERGLLLRNPRNARPYALSPALGVALAARDRPAFIVTASAGPDLRPLCLYALGHEDGPVRGLVVEAPISLPGPDREYPNFLNLGPLRWLYSYALLTPDAAALMLAKWVGNAPPDCPRDLQQSPYILTLLRPGAGLEPAAELLVLGDGATARVTGAGVSGEFDKEALQSVLLDLFASGCAGAESPGQQDGGGGS